MECKPDTTVIIRNNHTGKIAFIFKGDYTMLELTDADVVRISNFKEEVVHVSSNIADCSIFEVLNNKCK